MPCVVRQIARLLVAALLSAGPATTSSLANSTKINVNENYVAIDGYDTVAYFTLGKPTKGDPRFEVRWEDARWHFANAEHRDMFARDPERYAPRFGGFSALGMSRGYLSIIDPETWRIVDGRLFLAFDQKDRVIVEGDLERNLERAEQNWRKLRTR